MDEIWVPRDGRDDFEFRNYLQKEIGELEKHYRRVELDRIESDGAMILCL